MASLPLSSKPFNLLSCDESTLNEDSSPLQPPSTFKYHRSCKVAELKLLLPGVFLWHTRFKIVNARVWQHPIYAALTKSVYSTKHFLWRRLCIQSDIKIFAVHKSRMLRQDREFSMTSIWALTYSFLLVKLNTSIASGAHSLARTPCSRSERFNRSLS